MEGYSEENVDQNRRRNSDEDSIELEAEGTREETMERNN
jgi:hypothetical protein